MANTNDLYELPRPTLAKVVNIGGVGMVSDVKPLSEKLPEVSDLLLVEAVIAGVPLITIPLFGDQSKNARLAEHHGFGLVLHKGELSVETLSGALEEITTNPRYMETAQRLSRMLKLQPVKPADLLVRWSEFVAEFHTLENLEPAGIRLNFFQYYSLDVIALLLSALLLIIVVVTKLLKCLFTRVFSLVFRSKKEKTA
ncbi:hypothetical protein ANCCEY_04101 [Ancylostoma ceylanicum]|uniref:glucuronosyltransferase n=1 Tax=Ancylostoma ceylanicum TaxID=53326 RepID=A0A0D6LYD3_9BILA|nr:hypothetical protein ANCCEY_04101 [Ancylostoma ceylanicum]